MNTSGLAERGVVELSKASAEGPELTVFLAGDVCPNRKAGRVLAEGKTSDAFGRAAPAMRDADLAVLNLEAPVTRSRRPILKTGPNLKLDASIVAPLRRAGFEAVSLANNHIRDFGPAPVEQTVRLLEEHGFRWFGAGPSPAEAMQPAVMRVRGVRIALLGFAENEFGNADETGWGAAPMRPAINCEAVQQARRRADVVLVFVHGGNEFCPFPSPRMVELYRAYVRAGASAVVGSHAHVPQGFEVHNGAPIFYGLGNLLVPWPARLVNPYWYRGFAVRLVLTGATIRRIEVLPLLGDHATGTVDLMPGSEREQYLAHLCDLCGLLSRPGGLDDLWTGWCAMRGRAWLRWVEQAAWPARSRKRRRLLTILEGIVRCESHHELGTTFLKLVRTGRLAEARQHVPEVRALMRGYLRRAPLPGL